MNEEHLGAFRPDCGNCQALCCVAPQFQPQNGFPCHKAPGEPCRNLIQNTFRCGIWQELEAEGYLTCRSFDCFGGGQLVTRAMRAQGLDWPDLPEDLRARWFEQFGRLWRLRAILFGIQHGLGRGDHPLVRQLTGWMEEFKGTGQLPSVAAVDFALRAHGDIVGLVIDILSGRRAAPIGDAG